MLSVSLWLLGVALAITTALPLTNSVRWWIRMWDFPRLHIAIAAAIAVLVAIPVAVAFKPLLILILFICIIYQSIEILSYTPVARKEVHLIQKAFGAAKVSMMSANVLMENTRHADLIAIIERENPDVLFLMKTGRVAWIEHWAERAPTQTFGQATGSNSGRPSAVILLRM